MKKYYIRYPRNFGNEYDLRYVDGVDDELRAIEQGYERITKKEALEKCRAERWARKHDQAFSGYGSAIIVHLDFEGGESEAREQLTTSDGYIYE